jgi:Cu(I)/Ag(I) efflux system protein CusF
MKSPQFAALLMVTLSAWGVQAQTQDTDHASHHSPADTAASSGAEFIQGEVRRIDRQARKVSLRHGPIPNLQMPDMTMVFEVRDSTMLQGLKVGDKVRFKADKVDGAYTVTAVEPAQ